MKIRVLLIAPSLEILGGQSVQARRLVGLLRLEEEIEIDFQPINPPFPAVLRWAKRVRFLRTLIGLVLYCSQIVWQIPRYRVIHLFSAGLSSFTLWSIPALAWGRLTGRKVILNYRDGQVEEHVTQWRSALPAIRLADVVVSPADYVAEVLRRHGVPARRIYNIIDNAPFVYRQRRKLRPVLLTNRILEPLYNVPCILRAFRLVLERYPEATLTIGHDGPSRAELERLAAEMRLPNVRFIGRVPQEEIPALYNAADIYVTTPNFDCMPGSLLECYAAGLPVVATRVGGIPHIVTHEETGLLVEADDHEGLAAALVRLLEEPELVERLTGNARAELERYEWGEIREQWLGVYRELAG